MNSVIFRTEEAIFQFDRSDVIKRLEREINDPSLTENKEQLEFLFNSTEEVIEINSDDSSFGYIALDLIEQGIGQAICKVCNRTYKTVELQPTTIGFGKTPLDLNINMKGGRRNIFRRKKGNPSMFGGRGYQCLAGHHLLSIITWRT